MSYIDIGYIEKRIPDGSLLKYAPIKNNPSQMDTDRVNAHIEDACTLIDTKLQKRYDIPLVGYSNDLKKLAFDITIYFIVSGNQTNEVDKDIMRRYSEAVGRLNRIADGNFDLIGVEPISEDTHIVKSNKRKCDRVFTREILSSIR
jgi:phage gp36-like protein